MKLAPVTDVLAPPAGLSARSIHTSMRAYTPETAGGMLSPVQLEQRRQPQLRIASSLASCATRGTCITIPRR
jgi:hypothetical protein